MAYKSIVIAPCGNRSTLFKDAWLKQKDIKEFDLCLLFYHEKVDNPELYSIADYFYHLKDYKYHMLYYLLDKVHPEWLEEYDFFYFLDDDIEIDTIQINAMFSLAKAFNASIVQASLTHDSFCSWPMFKKARNSFCRFVGQIEVMAPLFSKAALKKCLVSFPGNKSSWGVDSVWSKILDYPKDKLIIFDCITMRHTQPVGGGELYQKIGVNPHWEWEQITKEYNAKKENYREYGRLLMVNRNSNIGKYYYYRFFEFGRAIKRRYKDFGFWDRVKSRLKKVFKSGNT